MIRNEDDQKYSLKSTCHGYLGNDNWKAPNLVATSEEEARPGYTTYKANEFLDDDLVLTEKIKKVAELIKLSQNFVVYTGAGISVASGIKDYASKSKNSVSGVKKVETINRLKALPTTSHYALNELYKAGYLKHWIQQNHDGLAQKAGFPYESLNEIHGSWFDKYNPVVLMEDKLKTSNYNLMLEWEKKADLCLSLGTSMSGMNADRVANACGQNGISGIGLGLVIINLQKTQYDDYCAIRIFAKLDYALELLINELGLSIPKERKVFEVPMNKSKR